MTFRKFLAQDRLVRQEEAIVPTEISGLPVHVLLVHAVVVLVPLAAVLLVLASVWSAFRRRLGVIVPLVALLALILVPVTTQAGEWLAHRVPQSSLVHAHTRLGDTLLLWTMGLFLIAAALWAWSRFVVAPAGDSTSGRAVPSNRRRLTVAVQTAIAILAVVVSAAAVVQTYRIGESGARAAWSGRFSQTTISHVDHAHGRD